MDVVEYDEYMNRKSREQRGRCVSILIIIIIIIIIGVEK